MKHWTPHDLRGTASIQMANAGVYPHITEKILNHRMKGGLAVYDHGEYLPERKAAMELCWRLIEDWVGNRVRSDVFHSRGCVCVRNCSMLPCADVAL